MLPDLDFHAAVASLLYSKIATPSFMERTGARGFLHLTRSRSRIGPKVLATVGAVSGGLRFSTPDRLVVIERNHDGYRVVVRARVVGEVITVYDQLHVDLDSIGPTLLDVLGTMRA